ncbi:MAG: tyrosine-type recombinase/integrase [Cyclobacteriaceae bacterium]
MLCDVKYSQNGTKKHFRFSTGIKCNPKNFNSQTILGREPNAESKNITLIRIKSTIERLYNEGLNRGKLPSPSDFKEIIKSDITKVETAKSTLDYFDDYLDSLRAKNKSRSFISGMTTLRSLLSEMQSEGISIRFEGIDLTFETKLRNKLKGFALNTVSSYIKRLKMFLNWAMKNNLHANQIYKLFEMEEESREIVALTDLEIDKINKLNIPKHKHIHEGGTRLIRDWFIVSTQTGVRYSDFDKVANAELLAVDGGYNIRLVSQKTRTETVIPVSKILYSKLKEYDFEVPLPPSNQKYNAGLKRISKLAKIKKEISSHTGRKTFCTLHYLKGTPVSQIMKMSGHKTEKEFYKYIGVSLTENADLVRKANPEYQLKHESKTLKIA